MGAVGFIVLWAAAFLAGHFFLSWEPVRKPIIAAVGERPFRGLYSVVALATFIPLVVVFAHHKHAGPMLWNLRGVAPVRWLVWLLMLAALVIFVASFITPSLASIGAPASEEAPHGILKLTRHPTFVALSIFGLAHILMNAWIGDVVFFGTFPALGIAGGLHQDRRMLREMGERYRRFMAQTSFFPGAALLDGRQRLELRADVPWRALAIGVMFFVVLIAFHHELFGGYPLG